MQTKTQPPPTSFWQPLLADRYWAVSLLLCLLGTVNAGYLSWTKLTNTAIYCGPGGTACEAVSSSIYGYVMGIPVAYLGLGTYLVLIALLVLERRLDFLAANGPIAVFGITLFGVLFTGYLQYASLVMLREVCPYCVTNAILMLLLFVVSIVRLRRALA